MHSDSPFLIWLIVALLLFLEIYYVLSQDVDLP